MIHRSSSAVTRRSALGLIAAAPALAALSACSSPTPDEAGPRPTATSTPSEPGAGATPSEPASPAPGSPAAPLPIDRAADFAALELEFGARLGVFALDTGSDERIEHRADESFAFCSTIKAIAAGLLFQRRTVAELEERVSVAEFELLPNSPISEQRVGVGLSWREAADAAVRYSDNTAANLIVAELGGPEGATTSLRSLGDTVTRLDRYELELNTAVPGAPRDTSSPRALATTLRTLALGDALEQDRREILVDLLRRNTTGDALIRAGVPADWIVGDKTGAGDYGTRNDIGILWPPGREPIVLALLSSRADEDAPRDDALIARAAEVVAAAFA